MNITLDEIRSKAPTKKATHYSISDNKVIYLKKNKNYGWEAAIEAVEEWIKENPLQGFDKLVEITFNHNR